MLRARPLPPLTGNLLPLTGNVVVGWAGPIAVALFAGFLRFYRLSTPRAVVFDETYYAKDAYSLLTFGYEHVTLHDAKNHDLANPRILDGRTDIWQDGPSFIAHPPGGKWMIAAGEWLFGLDPFGWRFMAALFGTLSVLILARIGKRMTGSTLLGCAAGLLLALDGLHFVASRTAILDIFVMFWVLAAFGCLLVDRDTVRARRLASADDAPVPTQTADSAAFGYATAYGDATAVEGAATSAERAEGPGWWGRVRWGRVRWWRLAAAVCLGLACSVKWSGIYYVIAFGAMTLLWDVGSRRMAGGRRPWLGMLRYDLPGVLFGGVLAIGAYLATWSGWFATSGGWDRHWADGRGGTFSFVPGPLRSLWHYHAEILHFHTHLHDKHRYQSWPWDWPVLRRPVAFYYVEPRGCGASRCSQEVLALGTPAIWWASLGALVFLLGYWLVRRDWRAGAIVLGYLAGWVPWFYYAFGDRTMFAFYATPMIPFMCLAIVLTLGLALGPAGQTTRRTVGAVLSGAFLLIVIINFGYLYPILTAEVIPFRDWQDRIWFNSWV
ncbi:phospholipid carrier-dependent glycosyltransferase [Actinomadura barringtoniae]|uniref:Polyprenol-phosphate-mannose--protein mannosyltransferase n=1 Tax=Actinomadura barringtoniae TaxID=1427535 RepID=A0A939T8L1_9ACTN|nr:phospholipid carrier-dependent glycosyltransferase [Actinomadura barringtoniae]MBO2447025.1 phospholipid carrier-dependent glycosyltransferase [Actinomadura barringtoniae]